MPPAASFHIVDLHDSGAMLTVQWRSVPGENARQVEAATLDRISKQVAVLVAAERHAGLLPSLLTPAAPGLAAAQRVLGEALYALLDGPDRALTRWREAARREAATLHLVVRLRAASRNALARHRALGWHLQLVASPDGPLALAPDVTLAVQLGDAEITAQETVPGGRLRVLFMAYSPRNVEPVLDYEAEEERFLVELAPFVESRRLVLKVAEEGSLDELRRRLMHRAYDVVHLTGHGEVTKQGPRLVMEDATGDRDDVSAERLLETLRAGRTMPRLLVISSCHSAEQRADLPSLAAELIQGGVPCVVGWTRPVREDVATHATEELYRRLCSGDLVTEAVACARRELDRDDRGRLVPVHAWATLELLATKLPGFAIDPNEPPVRDAGPAPGSLYRMLGTCMRVLTDGFVGRRRELQALGRILRHGRWTQQGGPERAVAGALVVGMKGQGKSCLVGRALDRHQQDSGELSLVVLHGALNELQLLEAFRAEAMRLGDHAAEKILNDTSGNTLQRIEWLLRHHWRERRLVIVLDDFEQNLEIPGQGEAQPEPLAAEFLEVLLPVCRDKQPKLLVTSTARFALPAPLAGTLVELPLGALDGASVRKLWIRGCSAELVGMGPTAWSILCERFGRNARILDWTRQLLAGKTPDEVCKVMAEADTNLRAWKDQPLDEVKQNELAAAFLRHMAFEEAVKKAGPDAMAFIARARVYKVPVPVDAFAGLTSGLAVSLDRHVPALANLGLLEISTEMAWSATEAKAWCRATLGLEGCEINTEGMSTESSRVVYRVNPLVKPAFDAADGQTWHGVAAEYWWKAFRRLEVLSYLSFGWFPHRNVQLWEHALAAKRQDIADEIAANHLHRRLRDEGTYAHCAALAARHIRVFPDSVAGLHWAGDALSHAGQPREGRRLIERAVKLVSTSPEERKRRVELTITFARVLASLGEHTEAASHLPEIVAAKKDLHREGGARLEWNRNVAISLDELAHMLLAHGNLASALTCFEWSLEIWNNIHGTQDHPDVATSLYDLARVLFAQGDLAGARARLEWSLEIWHNVHATQDDPDVVTPLDSPTLLKPKLARARFRPGESRATQGNPHGTQDNPDVAASLHVLACVLHEQGDLAGARAHFERSLDILHRIHGTEDHPDVATNYHELGNCLSDLGVLEESERAFRTALHIRENVFGTRDHHIYAETELGLTRLMSQCGRPNEARELFHHAAAVLQTQKPNHPIVAAPKVRRNVESYSHRRMEEATNAFESGDYSQAFVVLQSIPEAHTVGGIATRAFLLALIERFADAERLLTGADLSAIALIVRGERERTARARDPRAASSLRAAARLPFLGIYTGMAVATLYHDRPRIECIKREAAAQIRPVSGRIWFRSGKVHEFRDLVDSDDTIGQMLETYCGDGLLYLPFAALRRVDFLPKTTFFDSLMPSIQFVDQQGQTAMAFVPILYSGSALSKYPSIRTGQMTMFDYIGQARRSRGHRTFFDDRTSIPVQNIAAIEFDPHDDEEQYEGDEEYEDDEEGEGDESSYLIGARIDHGRYVIDREIWDDPPAGRYGGIDTRTGRRVLVTTGTRLTVDPARLAALLRLDSPGVVPLLHIGFVATDLGTFSVCVEEEPMGEPLIAGMGHYTPRDAATAGIALAEIAAAVHDRGGVLGGISPHFAYRRPFSIAPRCIPFLYACAPRSSGLPFPITYACDAPEVLAVHPATAASDVFSLALTIAWLASPAKTPPIEGDMIVQMNKILMGKPITVPPPFVEVLAPALAKSPSQRPTIVQLRNALADLAGRL